MEAVQRFQSYIYIHYNVKSNPFGIDLFPSGVVSRHLSYQTRMNLSQEISPYFPHRLSTFHARTVWLCLSLLHRHTCMVLYMVVYWSEFAPDGHPSKMIKVNDHCLLPHRIYPLFYHWDLTQKKNKGVDPKERKKKKYTANRNKKKKEYQRKK